MSLSEIAPLATPFSKIPVSAVPASIARVTNSVFSSWIDHSLSSIFSVSSAFAASKRACAPALECSVILILQAPTSCSIAGRLSLICNLSASSGDQHALHRNLVDRCCDRPTQGLDFDFEVAWQSFALAPLLVG